jgi:predicted transcriptional regulator
MAELEPLVELEDFITVAQAAKELGITPSAVRTAINEGRLKRRLLHKRASVIAREDVERYRSEHLGRQGKRPQPEGLTEQQRKQRAYQQAYYQRRKAARRQQPPTEPTE